MLKKISGLIQSVRMICKYTLPALFVVQCALLPKFTNAQNNKIEVTGTVKDANGSPIGSATVQIKNTKIGTTTDSLGIYHIEVPDKKSVLVFSSVGNATKEELIGDRNIINVTLLVSTSDLDDVVVIGYGTQKKRDLTGSISTISARQIEEKQPVSIFDALQGMAPGLRIMANDGAPGSESSISVRGISTLDDNGIKPLYLVDGVPMSSINAINPNDIQSIEVLKDAASAAIYGSRSANGVIIITTKRGTDGRPQVNVNYLRSYNALSNRISQSNREERVIYDRRGSLGLDEQRTDSTSFSKNSDNDYQALITQLAVRNQVDVSVMGGTKTLNYFNSIQYLDETGVIINSYNKRFNIRTNVEYTPSTKFKMSTRLNFSYQDRNNINEGNVIAQSLQRPPGMALYFPNGEYIYFNGGRRNPLAEAYLRNNISKIYEGVIYQGFDLNILKPLIFHADASADITLNRTTQFASKFLSSSNPPISTGSDNSNIPIRLQGNGFFTYSQTIGGKHHLAGVAGFNYQQDHLEQTNISGSFFVTEAVHTLNAAGQYDLSNLYSKASESAQLGFYGRASYDYLGRYLLNATIRRDGSSVFGSDNRWGDFPSVSVGWRFTDERFLSKIKNILTDGKLRASYGVTGNQSIGDYDAYQQYIFGSYIYNGVSGVRTNTQLGNNNLRWESTAQTDIGMDLTFLNSRATFTADYYIKNTKDLLYNDPLPYEVGFPGSARVNRGGIQNKGIELTLSGYPIRTKDFTWNASVNWTMIRNKITSLPTNYIDDIWSVQQGEEAGNFYGYKYLGIYQYDQSNAYTPDYKTRLIPQFQKDAQGNVIIAKNMQPILLGYDYPDGKPYSGTVSQLTTNGVISKGGDVIWQNLPDANGVYNGDIGNEDRQFLGHGQPRWSIGFSNRFTYKAFSFSINMYGNFGNMIYNENRRNLASFSNSNTTPDSYFIYNMWKYPGQITDTYRGGDKTADNMRRGGSQWLENGSFLRLQSARFGYMLPSRLSKKIAMQNLNIYIYGSNLLTWTDYTGFDPEVAQNSVLKPGNDTGKYPRHREFGFGINASF